MFDSLSKSGVFDAVLDRKSAKMFDSLSKSVVFDAVLDGKSHPIPQKKTDLLRGRSSGIL